MKILGTHDEATVSQLQTCLDAEEGAQGVLCADGHKGYSMPIGGVIGYKGYVSPSGVGYDIACGNLAVPTQLFSDDIPREEWSRLADEIQKRVSFGIGRKNNEPVDDPVIDEIGLSPVPQQAALQKLAEDQLGTVGSGNHYVDILEDETGRLWIGVHFGSRGFGHKTATGFMRIAAGGTFYEGKAEGEMDSPPLLLDVNAPSGQDYIQAMELAGKYAYSGREQVVKKVLEILCTRGINAGVHNHHNFTWKEKHGDTYLWVVRKGATPAFPGQFGFVGGSMRDISVILKGIDSPESVSNLYSTVHGAGRVMSRTKAAGKSKVVSKWRCLDYRKCSFAGAKGGFHKDPNGPTPKCPLCGHKLKLQEMTEQIRPGLIDFSLEQQKVRDYGVELRGAGADEATPAYRQLQSVLDAHAGTIEIVHTLRPKIVVMAGTEVYDPFKD